MFGIVLAFFAFFQGPAQPAAQDEIKDALAHAEALYYGARFSEAITVLKRVDESLKTQPGRVQDKVTTKLRLALAHVGLNDTASAKSYLSELYSLDPNYVFKPEQFSPKILALAADAKAEQGKMQCFTAQVDARTLLESGQTGPLLDLMKSLGSKCTGLATMSSEAAEALFRAGAAAYRAGELQNALSKLEAAVALSPEHELAREYLDLIRNKLQVSEDRLLLQWQRNFASRQFDAAAADYRSMAAMNDGRNTASLQTARDEYRKALSTLVESWNRTCSSGDAAAITTLRREIAQMLPEPGFGEDIRSRMIPCTETPKPAPAPTVPVSAMARVPECLEMQSQLLLPRLKSRVDPIIPADVRAYLRNNPQVVVRVKARISETGDVMVTGVPESNPALTNVIRAAVTQWKFTAIRDQSGPRCVDTEIPITIKLTP